VRKILINVRPVYWSLSFLTTILGFILCLAPDDWYGPSWHYFPQVLPHNACGMGLCCVALGLLQGLALWFDFKDSIISILFFLSGLVFWIAGITLGAEGLLGHQGLMETPFMMYVGGHQFVHSAALMSAYRREKRRSADLEVYSLTPLQG
jgi:hypothetical protein